MNVASLQPDALAPRGAAIDRYLTAVMLASALSTLLAFYSLGFAYQALVGCAAVLLLVRPVYPTPLLRTLAVLFMVNLVAICIASVMYDESLAAVATAVVRNWAPALFVAVLAAVRARPDASFFVFWYRLLVVLTAVAYLQYFFSPTLWGLIPSDFSTLTEWSEGKSFEEYALFYRATSLLGSPQVWGAYAALSIFVLAERLRGGIGLPMLCFLWGGAILSGNKVSVLVLLVFVALRVATRPARLAALLLLVPLVLALVGDQLGDIRVLERIFNVSEIAEQEQEGRLAIWSYVLGHINPVFGGGASFIDQLARVHHFVAESYVLQAWVEVTIIFPLVFLFLLARQFVLARSPHMKAFAVVVLLSTLVSHAFSHPAFIIMWPVLLDLEFRDDQP